jgi:hypothetical protein
LTVKAPLTVEVSGNRHLKGLDPAGTWPSTGTSRRSAVNRPGDNGGGMLLLRCGPVVGEELQLGC